MFILSYFLSSPHGAAIYVSDIFEGRISDTRIVRDSGFLNFLEPNDGVLADRGFKAMFILTSDSLIFDF